MMRFLHKNEGVAMAICQICKHDFSKLRFQTERIKICTRCVNTLNEFNEPAVQAKLRVREMLARGMQRNAQLDLASPDDWKRRKAAWTLKNFDLSVDRALHDWITKLLADDKNRTRDFKMLRAERRGLLRMDVGSPYDYPINWREVSARIKASDKQCADCGSTGIVQDVHHIIYLSRHGTNRQENLVRLCRPCHQKLHGFEFDIPEALDPESAFPIQFPSPDSGKSTSPVTATTPTRQLQTNLKSEVEPIRLVTSRLEPVRSKVEATESVREQLTSLKPDVGLSVVFLKMVLAYFCFLCIVFFVFIH